MSNIKVVDINKRVVFSCRGRLVSVVNNYAIFNTDDGVVELDVRGMTIEVR